MTLSIDARQVGPGHPAFIIAEVAQAHDGSLGLAHSFIDAAAAAGADAVKFQTHIAAAESTLDEPFRIRFTSQDDTRYAYWKRMEFTAEQWSELASHAAERKLVFLSSVFSLEATELLSRLGVAAWKIASGELGSTAMLDAMAASGAPFIMSTGMSTWTEIEATYAYLIGLSRPVAVLQCTSKYPTSLQDVGLNVIHQLRDRLNCPVGLSDHSGSVFPALAALARGADIIEVHLTFDRAMFGPDASSSLTVADIRHIVSARDAFAAMAATPVDKDTMAEALQPVRRLFTRSIAPRTDLPAGTVIVEGMLTLKKPGTGMPAAELAKLVGRRLKKSVSADRLLTPEDLE